MAWEILITAQVETFLDELFEGDRESHRLVNQAILVLERNGPAEGRPLVDTVVGVTDPQHERAASTSAGRTEIRILFVFDPWRSAILLIAGDKAGRWTRWYRTAIPEAERLYATYVAEREKEADDERG